MITGVTLIDYREKYSTKEFCIKRIRKTVIPFFAWSIIGVMYMIFSGRMNVDFTVNGIRYIISSILNANVITIYWFFIPLFSIYVCLPVISLIPKNVREKIFYYSLLGAFVLNIFIPRN